MDPLIKLTVRIPTSLRNWLREAKLGFPIQDWVTDAIYEKKERLSIKQWIKDNIPKLILDSYKSSDQTSLVKDIERAFQPMMEYAELQALEINLRDAIQQEKDKVRLIHQIALSKRMSVEDLDLDDVRLVQILIEEKFVSRLPGALVELASEEQVRDGD